MSKITTSVTVEQDIFQRAKSMGINISAELENALRNKKILKNDLPEEVIIIKCSICGKEIEEGYLCPSKKIVFCIDCGKSYDMSKCLPDEFGEHQHIRWPGFEGRNRNVIWEVKSIMKEMQKDDNELKKKYPELFQEIKNFVEAYKEEIIKNKHAVVVNKYT